MSTCVTPTQMPNAGPNRLSQKHAKPSPLCSSFSTVTGSRHSVLKGIFVFIFYVHIDRYRTTACICRGGMFVETTKMLKNGFE